MEVNQTILHGSIISRNIVLIILLFKLKKYFYSLIFINYNIHILITFSNRITLKKEKEVHILINTRKISHIICCDSNLRNRCGILEIAGLNNMYNLH